MKSFSQIIWNVSTLLSFHRCRFLAEDIKDDIGDINNSIPDDFTSDFVTLRKVYNSKLSEDDMLYESNRNKSSVTNGKQRFH